MVAQKLTPILNLLGGWQSYTPTLSNLPGSVSARYCRVGKLVTVEFVITASGVSTGLITLTAPSTFLASNLTAGTAIAAKGGTNYIAAVLLATSPAVSFMDASTAAFYGNAVPSTWASGHTLSGTFTYREA